MQLGFLGQGYLAVHTLTDPKWEQDMAVTASMARDIWL